MLVAMELPLPPLRYPGLAEPKLGDRALFPSLTFHAYLAHAAISPLNAAGARAVQACVEDVAAGGAATFLKWAGQRARLRGLLGALLGVAAKDIALTPGTSHGISDLALGLPLGPRDRIALYRGEFPANVIPWQIAAERTGAQIHWLPAPNPGEGAERILAPLRGALEHGAKYVAVSAVQFQTGFAMPLGAMGALCREFGAWLLVDAIQAVGGLPFRPKELGVHAATVGAHKWLLGTEGAGALYVAPELAQELTPLTLGWESYEGGAAFLFEGAGLLRYDLPVRPGAQMFEGSTTNACGFAALEAGVEICVTLGPEAIFRHVQGYHDTIEPALKARGFRSLRAASQEGRSCLLSFDLPPGVELGPLVRSLRAAGVMVSSPDGRIRLAPHFANNVAEIPFVLSAVDEALKLARK